VLDTLTWKQLSAAAKLQLSAYPIHVGSIYGLPTKILALLVCILILAMSVTGVVMWWIRRPRGRTGFPQKPALKPAKWLILLICVLGVMMPAAGISMLLILVGDGIWRRWRKRRQRRALST
jgi:uncharacterized iron-regulated membrane protein